MRIRVENVIAERSGKQPLDICILHLFKTLHKTGLPNF